jgi:hypothetical protein
MFKTKNHVSSDPEIQLSREMIMDSNYHANDLLTTDLEPLFSVQSNDHVNTDVNVQIDNYVTDNVMNEFVSYSPFYTLINPIILSTYPTERSVGFPNCKGQRQNEISDLNNTGINTSQFSFQRPNALLVEAIKDYMNFHGVTLTRIAQVIGVR